MKIDTQAGDPKAEFSTRKQGRKSDLRQRNPGPESRLIRRTEIYLQELKAKGICFNLSLLMYWLAKKSVQDFPKQFTANLIFVAN